MILLGMLIIAVAVLGIVLGLWLTTSNSTQLNYDAGPVHIQVAPVTVFIAGLLLLLLVWLGWWMMRAGARYRLAKRRERKELQQQSADNEKELKQTRAELEKEQERADREALARKKAEVTARAEDGKTEVDAKNRDVVDNKNRDTDSK